uniref:Probable beta-glucosidase G n=1 Tax=Haptolina brevifila TaxID=156173 RepID=A0A7S2IVB9_9EUKA|mmetsp:Transcript_72343/g.143614  ORF Transcript_72343/g.143614 Transcript_72343/m.143614 type:complete len:581 (+) Transcript_72343:142-1884(+)
MGAEFKAKGANMQLGPGLNVARVPRGGRNFEYMSGEDPHLGAMMARPVVKGIQSKGVLATAKHFILNNQEDHRGNMSSNVDERTLMQIYMPPFAAAVDAGVGSIMCGYNRVNNVWACEDAWTLKLLRRQLHFTGWVMSDWGATQSTAAAASAGLDMEMPGGSFFTADKFRAAIGNGSLTSAAISNMATHVLTPMFAKGIMDSAQPSGRPDANATSSSHDALAVHLATAAAVLLKNEGQLLPLTRGAALAVIGPAAKCDAPKPDYGFGWPPSIGCLNSGGGSGGVAGAHYDGILGALTPLAASVTFDEGNDARAAAATAAAADVAVVVVGSTSCEGADRSSVELPEGQLSYLRAVAAAQPRTVVVLMAPGAVAVGQWAEAVAAIVCFFLPGQAQGTAVANILSGTSNPSGRLPVTFPTVDNQVGFSRSQYPGVAMPDGLQTNYAEKLAVGYRWYHATGTTPGFCFGHGLSYSTYTYGALQASPTGVAFTLTNSGTVAGAEVAQLYITFPSSAGEPPRQLKGFRKVLLQPGESATVTLPLGPRDFSIWDVAAHVWAGVGGVFEAEVGASSCDIRARANLTLK